MTIVGAGFSAGRNCAPRSAPNTGTKCKRNWKIQHEWLIQTFTQINILIDQFPNGDFLGLMETHNETDTI